jgi:hypothetical protein
LHALAGQVAQVVRFGGQNRAGGQNTQSQQVGQIACVRFVAAMLEPLVLFYRRGVRQMNREALRLQTIDEPVPVVGRFHHDACQFVPSPSEKGHDSGQLVRQVSFRDHMVASSITLTTLLFECRSMPQYFILASFPAR